MLVILITQAMPKLHGRSLWNFVLSSKYYKFINVQGTTENIFHVLNFCDCMKWIHISTFFSRNVLSYIESETVVIKTSDYALVWYTHMDSWDEFSVCSAGCSRTIRLPRLAWTHSRNYVCSWVLGIQHELPHPASSCNIIHYILEFIATKYLKSYFIRLQYCYLKVRIPISPWFTFSFSARGMRTIKKILSIQWMIFTESMSEIIFVMCE